MLSKDLGKNLGLTGQIELNFNITETNFPCT